MNLEAKIWKSWALSVLSADLLGAVSLWLFIGPELEELFWYVVRGLTFVLFTIPLPIILSLVDSRNSDLDVEERFSKLRTSHILSSVLIMLIEGLIAMAIIGGRTAWGDFGPLAFGLVVLIYVAYGIASFLVWRIVFKKFYN